MASYAIRIELHGNPPKEEYDLVHEVMWRRGLYQTVTGAFGVSPLPHAFYFGNSTLDCLALRDVLVREIRAVIPRNIELFVVKSEEWASFGTVLPREQTQSTASL